MAYIMEYCPDGNVDDYRRQSPTTPLVPWIIQMWSALQHIHEIGLVHRDIKPQNILVSPDGQIRLSDFGLVVEADRNPPFPTTSNWISAGFSPPEQYRNMAAVSREGDVYSMGAVWFYLLTGETFDFYSSYTDQLASINVNPLERAILSRCLALEASERFSLASEVLNLLSKALDKNLIAYFSLSSDLRLKTVEQHYADCHDDSYFDGWNEVNIAVALTFLEDILEYEDDVQVRERATRYEQELDGVARCIVLDMINTNPP